MENIATCTWLREYLIIAEYLLEYLFSTYEFINPQYNIILKYNENISNTYLKKPINTKSISKLNKS